MTVMMTILHLYREERSTLPIIGTLISNITLHSDDDAVDVDNNDHDDRYNHNGNHDNNDNHHKHDDNDANTDNDDHTSKTHGTHDNNNHHCDNHNQKDNNNTYSDTGNTDNNDSSDIYDNDDNDNDNKSNHNDNHAEADKKFILAAVAQAFDVCAVVCLLAVDVFACFFCVFVWLIVCVVVCCGLGRLCAAVCLRTAQGRQGSRVSGRSTKWQSAGLCFTLSEGREQQQSWPHNYDSKQHHSWQQ